MKPRLLDLFSGICGFSIGFERANFQTVGFSEIEPFPCSVLKHHWPDVPNYGDIRQIDGEEFRGRVDVITFGSPCQDLSVAGKRAGFKGERSGLFHEAIRVIAGARPAFAIWENMPGALSSNGGKDFAAALDAMADIGALDIAWRILDAQYFGVPQRRRRIFVVADFRGYRAREVLFEPEGLHGDSKKSREKRQDATSSAEGSARVGGFTPEQSEEAIARRGIGWAEEQCPTLRQGAIPGVAGTLGGGSGTRGWADDTDRMTFIPDVSHSLTNHQSGQRNDPTEQTFLPIGFAGTAQVGAGWAPPSTPSIEDKSVPLDTKRAASVVAFHCTQDPISGDISPALSQGNQQGISTTAIAFDTTQITHPENRSKPEPNKPCHSLSGEAHPPAVAFALRGREDGAQVEVSGEQTSNIRGSSGGSSRDYVAQSRVDATLSANEGGTLTQIPPVQHGMAVRRLTPREAERLQGFQDDWTNIPGASDSARYRALGNAVAVPVAEWIARRLAKVLTCDSD